MCLIFVCHSLPFLYYQFADALESMAKSRGSSKVLDYYVDHSFTVDSSALTLPNSDLILINFQLLGMNCILWDSSLKTWCHNLTNNRITLHIDNQVVVHSINNGVCRNDDIM